MPLCSGMCLKTKWHFSLFCGIGLIFLVPVGKSKVIFPPPWKEEMVCREGGRERGWERVCENVRDIYLNSERCWNSSVWHCCARVCWSDLTDIQKLVQSGRQTSLSAPHPSSTQTHTHFKERHVTMETAGMCWEQLFLDLVGCSPYINNIQPSGSPTEP